MTVNEYLERLEERFTPNEISKMTLNEHIKHLNEEFTSYDMEHMMYLDSLDLVDGLKCPVCGTQIKMYEKSGYLYCPNAYEKYEEEVRYDRWIRLDRCGMTVGHVNGYGNIINWISPYMLRQLLNGEETGYTYCYDFNKKKIVTIFPEIVGCNGRYEWKTETRYEKRW